MKVMLINESGERVGEVLIEEAERQAKLAGKQLAMVAQNVYRIVEIGKLKYEKNQKQRQSRVQKRQHKIKEIKLGVAIETHDIEVKANHIREFLEKGLKTKITVQFKGRQMAFQEIGFQKLNLLIKPFLDNGLATLDKEPKMDGKNLIAFLIPTRRS